MSLKAHGPKPPFLSNLFLQPKSCELDASVVNLFVIFQALAMLLYLEASRSLKVSNLQYVYGTPKIFFPLCMAAVEEL